jgi:hypothetical protein
MLINMPTKGVAFFNLWKWLQNALPKEFFINYRIGSHKHLDKLLMLPFVLLLPPPLPSSSSFGMRNLDGWKGRSPRILYK